MKHVDEASKYKVNEAKESSYIWQRKKKNKKKGSIRAWSITPYLLLTVNHYGKYTKVDKIFVFISQIIITSEAQFS